MMRLSVQQVIDIYAMDDAYYFHQTPVQLAQELLKKIEVAPDDVLYEPFRGEGAFYNNFPQSNPKVWSELAQGQDFADFEGEYDWVITNPPFQLSVSTGRVNSFWYLLDYFSQRAKKGIAFLGNSTGLSTLTPKRLDLLKQRGFVLSKVVVCGVKKWRGRYYFMVFTRANESDFDYLLDNF